MPFTVLSVSVPEGREADLLHYAATLASEPTGDEAVSIDRDRIEQAYLGGVSKVWRPFLGYLADHPDEWVSWLDLCKHIDRTPAQAAGMLGAAERRVGGDLPYVKHWVGDVRHFRMSEEEAEVIRALRDVEVDPHL